MNEDLHGYEFSTADGRIIRVRDEPSPVPGYVTVDVFDGETGDYIYKSARVAAQVRAHKTAEAILP